MVALPIAALLTAGVAGIYYQMVTTRAHVDDTLSVNEQLQSAGAWFSLDAVQAQIVRDNNLDDSDTVQIAVEQDTDIPGTEVLVLQWTDWDNNVVDVVYSLVAIHGSSLKELHRTVEVNGTVTESHAAVVRLDDSVDEQTQLNRTRFEWSGEDKVTVRFVVTAEYGLVSATRMYEARPRSTV